MITIRPSDSISNFSANRILWEEIPSAATEYKVTVSCSLLCSTCAINSANS